MKPFAIVFGVIGLVVLAAGVYLARGAKSGGAEKLRLSAQLSADCPNPATPLLVEINNDGDKTLTKAQLWVAPKGKDAGGAVVYDMPVAPKGRGFLCFKDVAPEVPADVKKKDGYTVTLDAKAPGNAVEWEAPQPEAP